MINFSFQAVVLVYDVTNHSSFENLHDWLDVLKETLGKDGKMPYLALVGNKSKFIFFQLILADVLLGRDS